MNRLTTDNLVFSRAGAWLSPPQVWSNGPVLCEGQSLKALAMLPPSWDKANVVVRTSDGKRIDLAVDRERMPTAHRLLVASELGVGQYVLDLEGVPDGEPDPPHGSRESELLVVNRDDFLQHWLARLGGEWDKPIDWRSATNQQVEQLLDGLPLEPVWMALGVSVPINRVELLQWLGPITGGLIADALGGETPFVLRFNAPQRTHTLPGMDLVKVIWLLQALAPMLADAAIFSRVATLTTELERDGLHMVLLFDVVRQRVGEIHLNLATSLLEIVEKSGRQSLDFQVSLSHERVDVRIPA